jgi:hypothetical protein
MLQDSRGRLYGLGGDFQGFEYELPGPLRFAFAVEAGYGLVFLERVSRLYQEFDAGAGVDAVALVLAPSAEGKGCASDGGRPETGHVAGSWGPHFAYPGRDGEVFEGLCVAALGADELAELLVGCA